MTVAIEIPDDIGRVLGGQAGDVSRAVLEAVAVEAYRSGTITPAQVQQMLGLRSRWVTESLLRRAEAYRDCHIVPGGFSVMTCRRFAKTRRIASSTASRSFATSSERKRRTI